MNEQQLAFFVAVAEAGSFSKAEHVQYISKQAIIQQINSLENEVGVKLLERSPQGVALTPAGREMYHGAKRELLALHELRMRVRAFTENDTIRLANIEHHILLDPITARFHQLYPAVKIVKSIFASHSELELIKAGKIDVAEVPRPSFVAALEQDAFAYTFCYEKIAAVPYLCIMKKDHRLAGERSVSLRQLAGEEVVFQEGSTHCLYPQELVDELARHTTLRLCAPQGMRKISVVNQVCETGAVYVSPSPFLNDLTDYAVARLAGPYSLEYGAVFLHDPSQIVKDYIEVAKTFSSRTF